MPNKNNKIKKGKKGVMQNVNDVVVSSVQNTKGTEEKMGIQKKGDHYVVSVWDGKSRYENGRKKYIREEVSSKKVAEKRENELMDAIKAMHQDILHLNKQEEKNNELFSAAYDKWQDEKSFGIAETTWRRYENIFDKHILPYFGKLTIDQITPEVVESYFKYERAKEKKLSETTLTQHYIILNDLLKSLGSNAAEDIKMKPVANDKEIICIKEPYELREFVDSFKKSILYLPVFIAANTGMRLSEIAGLKWMDADLKNGYINVNRSLHHEKKGEWYVKDPKRRSRRAIKVGPNVIKELEDVKNKRGAKSGDFICVNTQGNPLNKNTVSPAFIRMAMRNGYVDLNFKSLRHSHATILIMIYKVPIKTVSRRLGHKDIITTLSIYTGIIQEMDELAANAMDDIWADTIDVKEVNKHEEKQNDTDLTRQT